jgi:hypothetical protein
MSCSSLERFRLIWILFESRFRDELAPFLMGSAREKADWFQSWLEDIRDERAKHDRGKDAG